MKHMEILQVHEMLVEQNLLHTVFYDGSCKTPQQFMQFVRGQDNAFFLVYDKTKAEYEPAAIWWLNGYSGRSAQINFTVFRDYFSDAEQIGKYVCDYCLEGDNPYLDALYGLTPAINRAALAFIKRIGFERLATLPAACDFHGRIVPGILTIKQREQDNG